MSEREEELLAELEQHVTTKEGANALAYLRDHLAALASEPATPREPEPDGWLWHDPDGLDCQVLGEEMEGFRPFVWVGATVQPPTEEGKEREDG